MKPSAILLDIDGTIYQGDSLISGASETLLFLKNSSIPFRFITNTTRMTRKKLVIMLEKMGLSILLEDVFTAPYAASIYCHDKGYKKKRNR